VRDDAVVERLDDVARHDWKHSHPMDLSDKGLLADLEDRIDAALDLGIAQDRADERKKKS
jgi:hypothetical protein